MEHDSDDYTNCDWCFWYNHQKISTKTGRLGNNVTSGDDQTYSIIEIGQNTEKSPRDKETPVRNHQLSLVRKTLKKEQMIIEVETLIHSVRIYSLDIGMEFGIEKCAMLVMKTGKRHMTEGLELPNKDKIRTLGENETYKYLGILEADTIKQMEMKDKIQKEYLRRSRKLLETKLSCRNLIKVINT